MGKTLPGLKRVSGSKEQRSQFIVSTHSPILMGYPGATILQLDRDGIAQVRHEDTEHVAITKAFLMNPARMLGELFRDIDDGARRDR